jgi:hypothetical protein
MKLLPRIVIVLGCCVGGGAALHAQIVVYSFTGNTAAATSSNAFITASTFTGSNSATLSNSSPVYSAGTGSYSITQSGWTGTTPGSNYFEFTITPSAGHSVSLTSISFGSRSTTTGPTAYSFRSSADGYGSSLTTNSLTNDGNWQASGTQSISLTFTGTTTFRLYANGASSAGGTLRVDDFTLNGSVSAIPEPSTYAAIFGATALVGTIWHRCRQKLKPTAPPPVI